MQHIRFGKFRISRNMALLSMAAAAVTAMAWLAMRCDVECRLKRSPYAEKYDPAVPVFVTADNAVKALSWAQPFADTEFFKPLIDQLTRNTSHVGALKSRHRTCAVVGNAPNILRSGYGDLINSHEAVFRMGMAPTGRFANDVGRKTTYRVSAEQGRLQEIRNQQAFLVLKPPVDLTGSQPPQDIYGRYAHALALLHAGDGAAAKKNYGMLALPFLKFGQPLPKGRMVLLSPEFFEYFQKSWRYDTGSNNANSGLNGTLPLVLAMHLCDKISVFGYGAGRAGRFPAYFNPVAHTPPNLTAARNHAAFLKTLDDSGVITVYPGKGKANTWYHLGSHGN